VRAAEEKMKKAHAALLAYTGRGEHEPADIKLHLQLANGLREAINEYARLVSQLN
jgi:hypothetical protein